MKRGAFIFEPSSYYSPLVIVSTVCACKACWMNCTNTQAKMTDKDGVIESRQQSSIKGSFSHSLGHEDTVWQCTNLPCCWSVLWHLQLLRLRQFDRSVSFTVGLCVPHSPLLPTVQSFNIAAVVIADACHRVLSYATEDDNDELIQAND